MLWLIVGALLGGGRGGEEESRSFNSSLASGQKLTNVFERRKLLIINATHIEKPAAKKLNTQYQNKIFSYEINKHDYIIITIFQVV